MTFTIKGGAPVSLCESCRFAQVTRGFRDSEALVRCGATSRGVMLLNQLIQFPVAACTAYSDKRIPTPDQLEEIALKIDPERVRVNGFRPPVGK